MTLRIYPDHKSLSRAAADLFVQSAAKAVQQNGRFSVALSGGGTPQHAYEILSRPPFLNEVDWSRVHVFWGDERCVPPDDSRSNFRMARDALLRHVPIPSPQIHPIFCTVEPAAGAREYEAELLSFFGEGPPRFDLMYLGMGENGHIASLFPESPVLLEEKRWVAEVYVAEQSLYRVTLTLPIINLASTIVFLVVGGPKADTLKHVLEGPIDPNCLPAQLVQPINGNLHWLVDHDAAALLETKGVSG